VTQRHQTVFTNHEKEKRFFLEHSFGKSGRKKDEEISDTCEA
jgi:hypothetical protein